MENFTIECENISDNEEEIQQVESFTLEIEKVQIKPRKCLKNLTTDGKVICEHCSKPVIKNYYQNHIQRLHLRLKNFICDYCSKKFFKKSSLASHIYLHLNTRPFPCPHDGCQKSFLSSTALATHIRFHHTRFNEYCCETCGKSYKQKRLLEEHVRSKHTGERIFKCDYENCESSYFSMSAMRKHLKSHEVECATCDQCGRIFKNLSSLKAHVRLSHSILNFVCEVDKCGKKFGSKCFLRNHMKIHNKMK